MPTYIVLANLTDEGKAKIKQFPIRVAALKDIVEKAGGQWAGLYYTFGQYDIIGIVDFPSDEAALPMLLAIGSQGNIRTITLKAFRDSDVAKMIETLP